METLRSPSPITSPFIGPSTLTVPAHAESIYPEPGLQEVPPATLQTQAEHMPHRRQEQATAIGHTATFTWFESTTSGFPKVELGDTSSMDIIHFTIPNAKEIIDENSKPKPLDVLVKKETKGIMDALDIEPISLPQKQKTTERVVGYTKRYTYSGSHGEKKRMSTRQRIAQSLAGLALIGTLAGSTNFTAHAEKPKQQDATHNTKDKIVVRPTPQELPTTTVIRGGQPIMGVSERQKKIIRTAPGLTSGQRNTLTDYTTAMHRVEGQLDGVNADVMFAQAIWEGNWDRSTLASKGHNLFGMKAGKNWSGKKGSYMTWEYEGGKVVHKPQTFREYDNDAQSFADHAKQMQTLPHFKDALGKDAAGYLDGILNGTLKYATDPTYKSKILNVIKKFSIHELTKIDKQPPHLVAVTDATPAEKIEMKIAEYAWTDYRHIGQKNAKQMRPAYINAVKHARDNDKNAYLGAYNGLDCGEFVVRVMRDSGVDPEYDKYEGNTQWQLKYLRDNSDDQHLKKNPARYHHIKPGEKLESGDIAVQYNDNVHHTFFYVGNDMPGLNNKKQVVDFNGPLASASEGNRAPMASTDFNRSAFEWYRIIPPKTPSQ